MNSNSRYLFILLILPLVFLFVGNNFHRAHYAGDPDYIYLMNAISLSRGVDAGHIDNPGTTVMEIGACILWLQYIMEGLQKDNLQYEVLKNPDKYVNLFRQSFVLLVAVALFITGWLVFSRTRNIWSALIFQITPFLSVNILEHAWTKVSPEPILLFIATIYAALLVVFYFDADKKTVCYLLVFSFIGGFGLATKATFLPVLIIPFFLLKKWNYSLYYFLGVVAFFFMFTLPAHAEYHRMFEWFAGLITHKGIYGGGERGFIDTALYFDSLINIFRDNPFFTCIFLISLIALFSGRFAKKNAGFSDAKKANTILLSLITANFLGVLIIAKHYHANHYLLPVLSLSGATFFFSVESLNPLLEKTKLKNGIQLAFIIVFLFVSFIWFVPDLQLKNKGYKETNEEYTEVNQLIECNYHDFMQIYLYPDGLNKFSAMEFGNGYSKLTNQDALSAIYPETFFHNTISGEFQFWEYPIPHQMIFDNYGKNLIFTGRPVNHDHIQRLNDMGIFLKLIYKGKYQALYELDTLKLAPYLKEIAVARKRKIYCNAEQLSDDGLEYIAGKYRISSGYTRSDDVARSGRYAVKMNLDEEYAFKILIGNLYPGQNIECSIWRYSANQNACLVASAENSKIFYKSSSKAVVKDVAGWQKLELKFSVPELDPPLERMLIYLWNKNKDTVYFDDLLILLD